MRIGIDGYPLARITPGIGRYVFNLLKELTAIDKKNKYILYMPNVPLNDIEAENISHCIVGGALKKTSTLWMQYYAKKVLLRDKIDLFWGTQGIIPLNLPQSIKTLVTIYDMTFYLYPHTMRLDNYLVNKFFLKKSIINAQKIITISNATADSVKNIFNSEDVGSKISVVYCGIADTFKHSDTIIAKEYVSQKFSISKRFLLFVGTVEPRKNISGLLKVFKILKTKYNIGHQLILVGSRGWKATRIFEVYKKLSFKENEVKFLGYVAETDLVKIYCAADLLVIPSFYEGFGMPPLEAMACGVPVVASNIPVFQEILNNAALLADIYNPHNLADSIYNVLTSRELSEELKRKGYTRRRLFSWERSAEKMLKIIDELMNS